MASRKRQDKDGREDTQTSRDDVRQCNVEM